MQQNKNQKPHTPSAYDEFLHSSEFDTLESNIDYFSAKPQTPRETDNRSRAGQARKKATVSAKSTKRSAKKTKAAPKQSRLAQEYAADKAAKESGEHSRPAQRQYSAEYLEQKAQLEYSKKQKQKKSAYITTLISACIITLLLFTFSVVTLAGKIEPYSETENRYLAGRPKLSASAIADGKYMQYMENYLSDQFAGRGALVKTRTAIDVLCGKKEINGVYIGKKHFLFEKPAEYDEAAVGKTIEAINRFSKKNNKLHSYFAIAPNASGVLPQLMPTAAPATDQQAQIKSIYSKLDKSIQTVDLYSTLAANEDAQSLYYKTDHHWTTKAAEIAFKQIAANMKIDTSKVTHQTYAVTNDFQGTMASSSGLFNAKDNIYITVPKTDIQYVVNNVSENKKSSSIFVSSKLEQQNKYEVFFGGNFSQINIDTTLNSKNVLLVVKDSYANCMMSMLVPYYKHIVIVDPRYFTDSIDKLVKNEGITDVLWLYNANTFLTDTSIQNVF